MLQSEYLELAIELYDIYIANDKHPKKWLAKLELEKCKRGPGFMFKVKKMKGKMSELQPVSVSYTHLTLPTKRIV